MKHLRIELGVMLAALFALTCCNHVWGADPVAPADKTPVIELPPGEVPEAVQKFDKDATKAREVPYHVALVKAPEAWAKNPLAKGKGMRIGIVDTGCQADHPGFDGVVRGGYNAITKKAGLDQVADGNGHGTHCAGIVHSILPEADLYIGKGLSDRGSGSVADLAHAIDYLVTEFKCDVISCSFGGGQQDGYLPAAIKRANDAGVIVVCAAGNDGGGQGRDTEGYPARYTESISVAACDSNRQLATFSSWGPNVYTADPGVGVWSLLPGTKEGPMSGTSMACPLEAGKVGSWINSNGVPKDKGRREKYLTATKGAMPFKDRNNARGYGLYEVDKVTGEAKTPPPPVNPPAPPGENVYTINLDDLKKRGYTGVKIELGSAASAQPIPVMELKPGVFGVDHCGPNGCQQAVPSFTGPGAVFQGFVSPPIVYQQMPQGCPGGVCQPAQQAPLLFPRLRGYR